MSASSPALSPLRLRLAEGGVLLIVAVLCLWFQLRLPGKLVAESDYQALAAVLQQEQRPGDVVLLYPWWTERARLYVPDGLRVVGYQGSDSDALELFGRVWVIAEPELPRSDLGHFLTEFGPQRTELGSERRFGNLSLRLFQNGRFRPLTFSAETALPGARVFLEGADGQQRPCIFAGGGFRCPNGGQVEAEWHEVYLQPRHCLRFYPPGGATKLVAEFAGVPASEAVALLAGYTWDRGFFKDGVTGSELTLEVNGAKTVLPLPAGLEGLQRVEARAVPQGATVRVSVSAANASYRDVCMELYGFGRAP